MKASAIVVSAVLAFAGCSGSSGGSRAREGGIIVHLSSALTFGYQVVEVDVTASPGGYTMTLAYDPSDDQFHGSLLLPVGAYNLTATALADTDGDSALDVAGSGSASVVVLDGATAVAVIRIVDATGPLAAPDHGPIIASVTASDTFAAVGAPLSLSATVVDVDGDPIAYTWNAYCDTGDGGSFSSPTAASTSWTPRMAGLCTVELVASANGLSDTVWIDVPVVAGGPQGAVQLTVSFVPRPYVSWVLLDTCYFDRLSTADASCGTDLAVGTDVYFEAWTSSPVSSLTVTDDCGGAFTAYGSGPDFVWGFWTAPNAPAVCTVTTRGGPDDTYAVAVNVR